MVTRLTSPLRPIFQSTRYFGHLFFLSVLVNFDNTYIILGTGKAVIRTPRRIRLGTWHRIQAKRWHRDGMLRLDDYDSVDGHSKGALRSLDTNQPTYIGGIPHLSENKLGNYSVIAHNLGMSKIRGNFTLFSPKNTPLLPVQ